MAFERMEGAGKREREEEQSSFLCGVSFVDPVVQRVALRLSVNPSKARHWPHPNGSLKTARRKNEGFVNLHLKRCHFLTFYVSVFVLSR